MAAQLAAEGSWILSYDRAQPTFIVPQPRKLSAE